MSERVVDVFGVELTDSQSALIRGAHANIVRQVQQYVADGARLSDVVIVVAAAGGAGVEELRQQLRPEQRAQFEVALATAASIGASPVIVLGDVVPGLGDRSPTRLPPGCVWLRPMLSGLYKEETLVAYECFPPPRAVG